LLAKAVWDDREVSPSKTVTIGPEVAGRILEEDEAGDEIQVRFAGVDDFVVEGPDVVGGPDSDEDDNRVVSRLRRVMTWSRFSSMASILRSY
jgi:hypothetical protein